MKEVWKESNLKIFSNVNYSTMLEEFDDAIEQGGESYHSAASAYLVDRRDIKSSFEDCTEYHSLMLDT